MTDICCTLVAINKTSFVVLKNRLTQSGIEQMIADANNLTLHVQYINHTKIT